MSEGSVRIVSGAEELAKMSRLLISGAIHNVAVEGIESGDGFWIRSLTLGLQDRAAKWAAIGQAAPHCCLRILGEGLQKPDLSGAVGSSELWPAGIEMAFRSAGHDAQTDVLRIPIVIVDNESALVAGSGPAGLTGEVRATHQAPDAGYVLPRQAAARLSIRFARRWNAASPIDGLSSDISVKRTNCRSQRGIEDAQRRIRLVIADRVAPASTRPRFGSTRYAFETFC